MKLTKRQIKEIKTALKQAQNAELNLQAKTEKLEALIVDAVGLEGSIDIFFPSTFEFSVDNKYRDSKNNYSHVNVETIIKHAENGEDILEAFTYQFR